jgi:transcriptional regulator of met regulon
MVPVEMENGKERKNVKHISHLKYFLVVLEMETEKRGRNKVSEQRQRGCKEKFILSAG